MRSRKRFVVPAAILAGAALLLWLTSATWLEAIGGALVADSSPERADAALVLAGDYRGERIMKACSLFQAGVAPVVFVSGPMEWYGVNEADMAVRFATSRGCPAGALQPVYIRALSTTEEARKFGPELKRRGIRTLLLVTSNFHTARAARTFRREVEGIRIIPVAAPDRYFTPDSWWRTREGQKTVFFEGSKTIADWIGL